MSKRQLTTAEKGQVLVQQTSADGFLHCFISDEVIDPDATESYEFDHLTAWAEGGPSDLANVRAVIKDYNRKKGQKTLYEARDNYRLEKLFEEKKSNIKLQDIFRLKEVERATLMCLVDGAEVKVATGTHKYTYATYQDPILKVPYFYARVPVQWLENDDQEGLQPRVIDYKRLVKLRNHLLERPQLAPSIARLVGNHVKLFDGQHKLAAQVLNGVKEVDVKVYVAPADPAGSTALFNNLMMTNLDAHSKLKQEPFYTSTLLDRLSVIYHEPLSRFITEEPVESHTEERFVDFLMRTQSLSKTEAQDALKAAIKVGALSHSALKPYVAKASKDNQSAMTQELLNRLLFPAVLYLVPSKARFNTEQDYRDAEGRNFAALAEILVEQTGLVDWVPAPGSNTTLTNVQRKARRIWHKGSVQTWMPYLESILIVALHQMTSEERGKKLYRADLSNESKQVVTQLCKRLFSHNLWDDPDPAIDALLVSAKKQDELFINKGLTQNYVVYGT